MRKRYSGCVFGIPCDSCHTFGSNSQYDGIHQWHIDNTKTNNLTFNSLFANINHKYFLEYIVPLFKKREVIFICNDKAKPENVFDVEKKYTIKCDRFVQGYYEISDKVKVDCENYNDYLYLFCAGGLSNVLIRELWQINKNNIYIDIGSALDGIIGLGKTRKYLLKYNNIVCKWGNK